MKKWFKSKTIGVFGPALLVSVALFVEQVTGFDLGTGISVDYEVTLPAMGQSVLAIVLRFATNSGIWPVTARPAE